MPCVQTGSRRSIPVAALWAATIVLGASIADAQGGPAWSATGSLGFAPPLGVWNTDLDPGTEYRLSVSRWRPGSRWALAAELTRHSFTFADEALARRDDGSARGFIRQTSLALGVRYALVERSLLSSWVSGNVGLHSVRTSLWREGPIRSPVLLRDEYAPGLSAGFGLAVGPFRLKPVAEVRLRVVALRERPLVSVPIAVGLRF
jgi:hypothetical protein